MSKKKDIRQASQVWSALDNLAKTDPVAYRSFIKEQIEQGRKMTSAPEPNTLIRISTRDRRFSSIYILICSWSRLPSAANDDDPLNVIGGKPYEVTDDKGSKTVQTLLYPLAFSDDIIEKYGSKTAKNEAQLELIEMCIDFLKKEKNIKVDTNSMYEICNETFIGSIDNLHSAFDYKAFNPETEFKEAFGDLSEKQEITFTKNEEEENLDEVLTELKINKEIPSTKVLIEEVDLPLMNVDQIKKELRIEISLPQIKMMREVELDISKTELHLEIPAQKSTFKPIHLTFPVPILVESTEAKFRKKLSKLFIVANF